MQDSPCSEQLNLKTGCCGVNDEKRENRINVLLKIIFKSSAASFSELSVYLMLNFLL